MLNGRISLLKVIFERKSSQEINNYIKEYHRYGDSFVFMNCDYAPVRTVNMSLFVGQDGILYKQYNDNKKKIALIGLSLGSFIRRGNVYKSWDRLLESDPSFYGKFMTEEE